MQWAAFTARHFVLCCREASTFANGATVVPNVRTWSSASSPAHVCCAWCTAIGYLPASQETHTGQRPTSQSTTSLISTIIERVVNVDLLSLSTLFPMVFSILTVTSLPTASITPLKRPYCISMIISSMQSDHRSNCRIFAWIAPLIFLPLSTPLAIK